MKLTLATLLVLVLVAGPTPARADEAPADAARLRAVAAARTLPAAVPADSLTSVRERLTAADAEGAATAWQAFVRARGKRLSKQQLARVQDWLLREALLDRNEALATAVDRARFQDERLDALLDHLCEIRRLAKSGRPTATVRKPTLAPAWARGAPGATLSQPEKLKLQQIALQVAKAKEALAATAESAQQANLDLQMQMDRQQKALQMMSNLSKKLADTTASVIKNLK